MHFFSINWVFCLIVLLGIAAVMVFFRRWLHLRRARIDYQDFLKGIYNVLEKGNDEEAVTICDETPGPIAAIVETAIRHRKSPEPTLRETIDNVGREEISRLERRLVSLALTCQIAPLLGLLGTVLGIIDIVIAVHAHAPLVQSVDVTAGLTQALLCTAAGLGVAIPCHVMYVVLMVRVERIVREMDVAASEIVAFLMHRQVAK